MVSVQFMQSWFVGTAQSSTSRRPNTAPTFCAMRTAAGKRRRFCPVEISNGAWGYNPGKKQMFMDQPF
jgi:hypothetical protein